VRFYADWIQDGAGSFYSSTTGSIQTNRRNEMKRRYYQCKRTGNIYRIIGSSRNVYRWYKSENAWYQEPMSTAGVLGMKEITKPKL
jgi:hypothetical protein